jgi:cyclomaltodextrinase / maltogenic alpha-amylase / neopullulanase
LHDLTARLIRLRRENMALTYGDLFVIHNDENVFAYVRSYFGKNVIVVFKKNNSKLANMSIEVPETFRIANAQHVIGNGIQYNNGTITFSVAGSSEFEVFY